MRSIWLASAAVIMSVGVACAQTSMSAPAPTGAPDAPALSPNPGASPGNMGGNMGGGGAMAPMPPRPHPHPMMAMGGPQGGRMMMPPDADADRYLHIAADAIRHHDKALADDALGHAETRMLTRAVPAEGGIAADDSPRVTAVEHARQALGDGDFEQAAMQTHMAMGPKHGPHGPMGGPPGGPPGGPMGGPMGGPPGGPPMAPGK